MNVIIVQLPRIRQAQNVCTDRGRGASLLQMPRMFRRIAHTRVTHAKMTMRRTYMRLSLQSGLCPKCTRISRRYSASRTSRLIGSNKLCRKAAATSPRNSAPTARVPPQPGQDSPVSLRNQQPGDISLTMAASSAGKHIPSTTSTTASIPIRTSLKRTFLLWGGCGMGGSCMISLLRKSRRWDIQSATAQLN